jgi:hypothetical protein
MPEHGDAAKTARRSAPTTYVPLAALRDRATRGGDAVDARQARQPEGVAGNTRRAARVWR